MIRRFLAFILAADARDLLEYSLLAAFIVLSCVASVTTAGAAVTNVSTDISVVVASLPVMP
jgi:hypothetical protein